MRVVILFILGLLLISCAFEDPYFSTIEVYRDNAIEIENNRIKFDGQFAIIKDLKYWILIRRQELDSMQNSKFYIKLKYSKETKKATITKVENILREANVLHVKYYKVEPVKYGF
jgi:hypothetical protein